MGGSYGDYSTGSTVFFKFTTVNSTGAPTAFSSGGVTVYRNGSTAPSTTGLTLTSTFAGVIGLNQVQVDMAGTSPFYIPGSHCMAVISSGAASEDLSGYVLEQWTVKREGPIADYVWDEVLTGATHNVNTSAGKRLREISAAFVLHSGTAQAGAFNTITLDTGGSTIDGFYKHARIVIAEGTGVEQERIVDAYDGATRVAIIAPPWIVTPDATSVFEVEPGLTHAETGWATVKVGIVQASGSSTVTLDSRGSTVDDYYNTDVLKIDSDGSTGAEGQSRVIIDYVGATKVASVSPAWTQTPTTAAEYIIEDGLCFTGGLSTDAALQVNAEVVDAVATDTFEEPAAGVPSTAESIAGMMRTMYHGLRNQITVSSSAKVFYGDAANILWAKQISQDSTGSTGVYTEAGASTST